MSPTRWFFKNSVKIGENQENSLETHWRQTVKPETPINWAVFQKNRWAISEQFVPKTDRFL
jgi:hypothetical protein